MTDLGTGTCLLPEKETGMSLSLGLTKTIAGSATHFLSVGKTLMIHPLLTGCQLSRARRDPALTVRVKLVPQKEVALKHFPLE